VERSSVMRSQSRNHWIEGLVVKKLARRETKEISSGSEKGSEKTQGEVQQKVRKQRQTAAKETGQLQEAKSQERLTRPPKSLNERPSSVPISWEVHRSAHATSAENTTGRPIDRRGEEKSLGRLNLSLLYTDTADGLANPEAKTAPADPPPALSEMTPRNQGKLPSEEELEVIRNMSTEDLEKLQQTHRRAIDSLKTYYNAWQYHFKNIPKPPEGSTTAQALQAKWKAAECRVGWEIYEEVRAAMGRWMSTTDVLEARHPN